MVKRSWTTLWTFLGIMALVAAACGGDDAATTTRAPSATTITAPVPEGPTIVGLITKTNLNPFFVKMREAAEETADELDLDLWTYAGTSDEDLISQVRFIEELISVGASGFLITPARTTEIVPTIEKATEAGLVVIVLDTPLDPIDAAQATFATDNFRVGELIGEWARATLDDPDNAKIAMLNISETQPTVGVLRNQGFLTGFGIDLVDPNKWGDETDPRIVGQDVTLGSVLGGRNAMERLLEIDPEIDVVYTVNELAARGAKEVLDEAGLDPLIVSVDGSCQGVQDVRDGALGATAMQFPVLMAQFGVQAAATGLVPPNSPGLDFFDTGGVLITDAPAEGVDSQDSDWGLDNCWD
jgi:fructose transport system substrate-binding protein